MNIKTRKRKKRVSKQMIEFLTFLKVHKEGSISEFCSSEKTLSKTKLRDLQQMTHTLRCNGWISYCGRSNRRKIWRITNSGLRQLSIRKQKPVIAISQTTPISTDATPSETSRVIPDTDWISRHWIPEEMQGFGNWFPSINKQTKICVACARFKLKEARMRSEKNKQILKKQEKNDFMREVYAKRISVEKKNLKTNLLLGLGLLVFFYMQIFFR